MLKKWLLVLSVPVIFQLIFLAVLLKSQADRSYAQDWAIHSKEVLTESATLSRLLVATRSSLLSELLVETTAQADFAGQLRSISNQVEKLYHLVDDNPGQQVAVGQIRESSDRYVRDLTEIHQLFRAGRRDEAISRLNAPAGQVTIDDVQSKIKVFLDEEERLDRLRGLDLSRAVGGQNLAIILGTALSLVIVGFLIVVFTRGFASRISILADNARRLADGRPLAESIGGKDELSTLDRAFRAMAKKLSERDQENEMFIYSVSHDLRSPLVNLQGFSKELSYTSSDIRAAISNLQATPEVEQKLLRLIDVDMKDSIHFIQNAVTRLSSIIDALLRLSRAGRVEYRYQMVDVESTVGRLVEALRNSIDERKATVEVEPLPQAYADPTVIEATFANLLSNAVKYLDPGRPGKISVGIADRNSPKSRTVTYFVRDNGLGIPSNHQTKLFTAFQRLHPGVAEGEGIGLALIKRMIERHAGKIRVESEQGVGSTFFVTFPTQPESHAADEGNSSRTDSFLEAGATV